uniref:TACC_C domain-containing protein n=1 Tax=Strongyloides papillosus TaxID=174720 RepID=A0A0N5BFJ5_STREA
MATTKKVIPTLSSKKVPNSKVLLSKTSKDKNRIIQKSIEDLTKRPVLRPKKNFGSTGSLGPDDSSQNNSFPKKLVSNKNTLSDDCLNKDHITKRNAIKAQPLQASVDNILTFQSRSISLSKEVVDTVQVVELTKEESLSRFEKLLTLISKIENEQNSEFPDEGVIEDLKSQCYRLIFKNSTTEKWMAYFQRILNEFENEERKIEEEGAKLTKELGSKIRQTKELEAEISMMNKYEKDLMIYKRRLQEEEDRCKQEIDNYNTTCEEIFTHFNNSFESCIYNKCENINNKINEVFDTFTNSSLERYKHMETLINEFKSW